MISLAPTPLVEVAEANLEHCQSFDAEKEHWGDTASSPNYAVRGVEASINYGGIESCTGTPLGNVSLWVSLEPRNPDNATQIVQIGAIDCSLPFCVGGGQKRFFWAYGGCNWITPIGKDLGPVVGGTARFKILEGSVAWYLYINDAVKATLRYNDPGVNCWGPNVNELTKAGFFGEKADIGDSFSHWTTTSNFTGMRYRYSRSGSQPWYDLVRDYCPWTDYNPGHPVTCTRSDTRMWLRD